MLDNALGAILRKSKAPSGLSKAPRQLAFYGKPNPSYGEIVAADLVVNAEFEAAEVLKRVRNTLESSPAKYKVP